MATRMATPVALGAIKDFDPEVDTSIPNIVTLMDLRSMILKLDPKVPVHAKGY